MLPQLQSFISQNRCFVILVLHKLVYRHFMQVNSWNWMIHYDLYGISSITYILQIELCGRGLRRRGPVESGCHALHSNGFCLGVTNDSFNCGYTSWISQTRPWKHSEWRHVKIYFTGSTFDPKMNIFTRLEPSNNSFLSFSSLIYFSGWRTWSG